MEELNESTIGLMKGDTVLTIAHAGNYAGLYNGCVRLFQVHMRGLFFF